MRVECFQTIPEEAIYIRKVVFCEEQGFVDEFDEIDKTAKHIVITDKKKPVGTCRFFSGDEPDMYYLGRIAVMKEYRGMQIGSKLIDEAEERIIEAGGTEIRLHAQVVATRFYEANGYSVCSGEDEEEGIPHVWMRKELK